jgi:hypothetical protein
VSPLPHLAKPQACWTLFFSTLLHCRSYLLILISTKVVRATSLGVDVNLKDLVCQIEFDTGAAVIFRIDLLLHGFPSDHRDPEPI